MTEEENPNRCKPLRITPHDYDEKPQVRGAVITEIPKPQTTAQVQMLKAYMRRMDAKLLRRY